MNKSNTKPEEYKSSELSALRLAQLPEPIIVLHYTSPVGVYVPVKSRAEAMMVIEALKKYLILGDAETEQ